MGQEQDWDRRDDRQCVSGKRRLFAGPVVGDVTRDEGGLRCIRCPRIIRFG